MPDDTRSSPPYWRSKREPSNLPGGGSPLGTRRPDSSEDAQGGSVTVAGTSTCRTRLTAAGFARTHAGRHAVEPSLPAQQAVAVESPGRRLAARHSPPRPPTYTAKVNGQRLLLARRGEERDRVHDEVWQRKQHEGAADGE